MASAALLRSGVIGLDATLSACGVGGVLPVWRRRDACLGPWRVLSLLCHCDASLPPRRRRPRRCNLSLALVKAPGGPVDMVRAQARGVTCQRHWGSGNPPSAPIGQKRGSASVDDISIASSVHACSGPGAASALQRLVQLAMDRSRYYAPLELQATLWVHVCSPAPRPTRDSPLSGMWLRVSPPFRSS